MLSKIKSYALYGLNGFRVDVEVDVSAGLPAFEIVGLPDAAIKEAKERVKAALRNSGFTLPPQKIIVNLAPADIKKMGSYYDLPIAIGILAKNGTITKPDFKDTAFIGELSLDGSLRSVSGVLPIAAGLLSQGIKTLIVPYDNAKEAAIVNGLTIIGAKNLVEIVNHLNKNTD